MIIIDLRSLDYDEKTLINYLDDTIKNIKGPRTFTYDYPDRILVTKKQFMYIEAATQPKMSARYDTKHTKPYDRIDGKISIRFKNIPVILDESNINS